ncbi:hypothetical protein GOY17_14005 [Lysobacter soli]|uniref:hypothetical protein n=1 Tax=Lysobacter soli TaxID=453783 RepID=UPI0012EEDA8D|nr:hypothetical protein [Lysobacter soli]QGW65923.1 hypothetical protein GOY17_14005 [Lysobacter soli]
MSSIELNLEQWVRLLTNSDQREVRIIGALSAARLLIGNTPLDESMQPTIEKLVMSLGDAL